MPGLFDEDDAFEDQYDVWDGSDDDDLLDELPPLSKEPFAYVGHKDVMAHLEHQMQSGRLPHALMFVGEQGVGKFTLAQALAHSLLSGKQVIAFEEDAVLTRMQHQSHSDYLYISGESNEKSKQGYITIDQVRQIHKFLGKTPGEAPMHVIIIDGVEMMNVNAANAVLKNLEEPPPHTLFILISHNQSGLLPTIRSRVQLVKFAPLSYEDCVTIISSQSQLALEHSDADIQLMSALAESRPGQAMQWLEAGAAPIYRNWLDVVLSSDLEEKQLAALAEFADMLTKDKALIHSQMVIFSELMLQFLRRAAFNGDFVDDQEQRAISKYRQKAPVLTMVESWFLLKDQFSLVQKLHLDYKHALITLLLRVIRGQKPLSLS